MNGCFSALACFLNGSMYLNWGYAEDFSESPLFQVRKSFTTANLCQNHQIRDTFSAKPRRDLRKTRLPPAPNARLERRREIGAIQAKMAHPKNNWKPRLKEDYLIVRLKSLHGWVEQHRRQKHCKPTASLRFHRKMIHLHRQKPQIPCIAMVMNLPTISGQPNDAAAQPMNLSLIHI